MIYAAVLDALRKEGVWRDPKVTETITESLAGSRILAGTAPNLRQPLPRKA